MENSMYESVSDEVVIPCLCAGPEYQNSYENLSSHELTEQLYTINALLRGIPSTKGSASRFAWGACLAVDTE